MHQESLFEDLAPSPGALPDGLVTQEEFLTRDEEAALIEVIRQLPLQEAKYNEYTALRRVVSYGGSFDYDSNELVLSKRAARGTAAAACARRRLGRREAGRVGARAGGRVLARNPIVEPAWRSVHVEVPTDNGLVRHERQVGELAASRSRHELHALPDLVLERRLADSPQSAKDAFLLRAWRQCLERLSRVSSCLFEIGSQGHVSWTCASGHDVEHIGSTDQSIGAVSVLVCGRGGNSADRGGYLEYLALASEVEDVWMIANFYRSVALLLRRSDPLHVRTRLKDASEGLEVVEDRWGVVDHERDRSNLAIS